MIAGNARINLTRDADFQPFPALLLVSFVAVRLYPYVPVIDLHKYIAAIRPLLAIHTLSRGAIFLLRGIVWLAVCYLGRDCLRPPPGTDRVRADRRWDLPRPRPDRRRDAESAERR